MSAHCKIEERPLFVCLFVCLLAKCALNTDVGPIGEH